MDPILCNLVVKCASVILLGFVQLTLAFIRIQVQNILISTPNDMSNLLNAEVDAVSHWTQTLKCVQNFLFSCVIDKLIT